MPARDEGVEMCLPKKAQDTILIFLFSNLVSLSHAQRFDVKDYLRIHDKPLLLQFLNNNNNVHL